MLAMFPSLDATFWAKLWCFVVALFVVANVGACAAATATGPHSVPGEYPGWSFALILSIALHFLGLACLAAVVAGTASWPFLVVWGRRRQRASRRRIIGAVLLGYAVALTNALMLGEVLFLTAFLPRDWQPSPGAFAIAPALLITGQVFYLAFARRWLSPQDSPPTGMHSLAYGSGT